MGDDGTVQVTMAPLDSGIDGYKSPVNATGDEKALSIDPEMSESDKEQMRTP